MSGPGRPRSEAARRAVLSAAVELVEEDGYSELTIERIARRAGVSKQTLYRWWSSKAAIVLEALNEGASWLAPLPDTGDLTRDVRSFVRRSVLGARGRTARLLTALMAEAQLDQAFARSFQGEFLAQRREVMSELLARAYRRNEIVADVDLDLIVELFFGALWYRLLAASGPINRGFAEDLSSVLLDLLSDPRGRRQAARAERATSRGEPPR